MDISKKLLTLLAIFCVIASAGAVCAADDGGYAVTDYADDMSGYSDSQYEDGGYADDMSGYSGSQYEDGGYAGSQYQDDGGWAGSQYNETAENALANQTAQNTTNVTSPVVENATADNATNATNTTASHPLLSTGNPILVLIAVCAVLGSYAILRRK